MTEYPVKQKTTGSGRVTDSKEYPREKEKSNKISTEKKVVHWILQLSITLKPVWCTCVREQIILQ